MYSSRRDFGRMAFSALPLTFALSGSGRLLAAALPDKPNSRWAGVQVGLNVPYSFGTRTAQNAEQVLAHCVALGISGVELRGQAIEQSTGLPPALVLGPAPSEYRALFDTGSKLPAAPGNARAASSPERRIWKTDEIKEYEQQAQALRKWRLSSTSLQQAVAVRKRYQDAGVHVDIVKFDGINDMDDAELDYIFTLAKLVGARTVSGEFWLPSVPRIAKAANHHKIWIGLHNHLAVTPAVWEEAFAHGDYVGANVDIGHYLAGNGTSPLPFIEKYHQRITHLHIKDKTRDNRNVEFGTGDTPIKEILQAVRDKRWFHIQATIEYEIPLPAGADRDAELRRSIDYCRGCLLG
jgi:sugar phosphate isomerase/epimerase